MHAVGSDASSTRTLLLSLSKIAGTKISNPPWVNFQSAGWVSFQSVPPRRIYSEESAAPSFLEDRHLLLGAGLPCLSKGPLIVKPNSLGQPGLNGRGAVLCFPFLEGLVVAAFGFDDFACVRIFIDLHLAWLTAAGFGFGCWSATTGLRIKQVDHVRQAVAVLGKQSAQLGFKFDFFLEASVAFQRLESLELFGEVFFELTEFCELGHDRSHFSSYLTVYCKSVSAIGAACDNRASSRKLWLSNNYG